MTAYPLIPVLMAICFSGVYSLTCHHCADYVVTEIPDSHNYTKEEYQALLDLIVMAHSNDSCESPGKMVCQDKKDVKCYTEDVTLTYTFHDHNDKLIERGESRGCIEEADLQGLFSTFDDGCHDFAKHVVEERDDRDENGTACICQDDLCNKSIEEISAAGDTKKATMTMLTGLIIYVGLLHL